MVIILSDSQSNLPESFISDYIKSENNISELKYNLLQWRGQVLCHVTMGAKLKEA